MSKESKNNNNPNLPVGKINFSLRESPNDYGSFVMRPIVGQQMSFKLSELINKILKPNTWYKWQLIMDRVILPV